MAHTWRASSEPIDPPAAGDDDGPVADDLLDPGGVLRDHRTPQQVLHPDPPDAIGVHAPVEQVVHGGDGSDVEVDGERGVHDAPDGTPRRAGHRDEERLRPGLGHGARQRPESAEDPQAGNESRP